MKHCKANVIHLGRPRGCGAMAQVVLGLISALFLISCVVKTDRLAVYHDTVLTRAQIEKLAGYYGKVDINGGFFSLSLAPRTDPWPYEHYPEASANETGARPVREWLAAADVSLKSVAPLDDDSDLVIRLDGVAVLSRIPGTDLVLASIAGESASIQDQGKMMPLGDQGKNLNYFFVFQPAPKTLAIKLYSENDDDLQRVFGYKASLLGSVDALPTAGLLSYLQSSATNDFSNGDIPILVQASQKQREAMEKKFEAVSRRNNARKTGQVKPGGG